MNHTTAPAKSTALSIHDSLAATMLRFELEDHQEMGRYSPWGFWLIMLTTAAAVVTLVVTAGASEGAPRGVLWVLGGCLAAIFFVVAAAAHRLEVKSRRRKEQLEKGLALLNATLAGGYQGGRNAER